MRLLGDGVVAGRATVRSIGRRRSAALASDERVTAKTDNTRSACLSTPVGMVLPTVPRRIESWPINSLLVGHELSLTNYGELFLNMRFQLASTICERGELSRLLCPAFARRRSRTQISSEYVAGHKYHSIAER